MPEIRTALVVERDLPQHQAVLTLIRDRLDDPDVTSFDWLDLGCGSGKILQSAGRALPEHFRAKITYLGIDLWRAPSLEAERLAKSLFRSAQIITSELVASDALLSGDATFDAVTMTNTVHEVSPRSLATLLTSTIIRIADQGFFFIYDMERLPDLELGAVPWRPAEIERIIRCLAQCCGCTEPLPTVSTWQHRTCNGWQIQIKRSSLPLTRAEMTTRRSEIEAAVTLAIADVLQLKLNETHAALDALSRYGSSTEEERQEARRLAYDFWAIARSLDVPLRIGETYDGVITI
ncbi:MAG TPA: class I SAM-dependent methyltransferase [Thermoanaerobaculia bacterium]